MTHEYTPTRAFTHRPGLYLENRTVMHEGKPFYGIGVNYFGAFLNTFYHPEDGELRRILTMLRENGVRYMRVCFGGFWPTDFRAIEKDKARFFEVADAVVAAAEEFEIGIIPSFFWNAAGVSDWCGEPVNAWGNPNSRTRRYARDYIRTVITRYKESPAMWMWEFGNELNLAMDLPNRAELRAGDEPPLSMGSRIKRTEEDDWFSDYGTEVLRFFAEQCRIWDIYGRMITSGNAEPRPTQYQQRAFDLWPSRPDTREEMAQTLRWHNPDPMDCVCIHTYDLLKRFAGSETYEGLFAAMKEESAKQGKALFVGEFSGLNRENALATIDALVKERVPLSAIWAIGQVEYSLDRDPELCAELLARIREANLEMERF